MIDFRSLREFVRECVDSLIVWATYDRHHG